MLIYNNIQAQQNSNNAQRTMKKERGSIQSCLHFFFSLPFVGHHAFVEEKLSMYQAIYQHVICYIQHFNAFTPINKSVGKTAGCPKQVLRMPTCHHADKQTWQHNGTKTWRHDVQSGQVKEE
ncbi:hypothetical protein, partial [Parabacteroides merdae]|uniref:hypothetical protein n=4 Tax=Parabacteroides merdae TaxID=46503 RepID=UPI0034A5687E